MDKTEQQFWRTELRDSFKALGHCCRIESHATVLGIPDLNLKIKEVVFDWWIELKVSESPGVEVEVSPSQWLWHFQRRRMGGQTMFLTRWHRPYGLVYTVNTQGPLHENRFDRWYYEAESVMNDRINWNELMEILRNEQV